MRTAQSAEGPHFSPLIEALLRTPRGEGGEVRSGHSSPISSDMNVSLFVSRAGTSSPDHSDLDFSAFEFGSGRSSPDYSHFPQADLRYADALTGQLMCDPVKCTDGRTYDRWTVLRMRGLRIASSDFDVRYQLFRVFPEQEDEFRASRLRYREEALAHASRGETKDAVTKLKNVLQWGVLLDEECHEKLKAVLEIRRREVWKRWDTEVFYQHLLEILHRTMLEEWSVFDMDSFDMLLDVLEDGRPDEKRVDSREYEELVEALEERERTEDWKRRSLRIKTRTAEVAAHYSVPILLHEDLMHEEKKSHRFAVLLLLGGMYAGLCYLSGIWSTLGAKR